MGKGAAAEMTSPGNSAAQALLREAHEAYGVLLNQMGNDDVVRKDALCVSERGQNLFASITVDASGAVSKEHWVEYLTSQYNDMQKRTEGSGDDWIRRLLFSIRDGNLFADSISSAPTQGGSEDMEDPTFLKLQATLSEISSA